MTFGNEPLMAKYFYIIALILHVTFYPTRHDRVLMGLMMLTLGPEYLLTLDPNGVHDLSILDNIVRNG